jgi:hypothetical protein
MPAFLFAATSLPPSRRQPIQQACHGQYEQYVDKVPHGFPEAEIAHEPSNEQYEYD